MAYDNNNNEIDPVRYGVLWQRVQDMDKTGADGYAKAIDLGGCVG